MTVSKPAEIRAWAKAQGLAIPKRGPLPKTIVAAYWAAYDDGPVPQP